MIEKALSRQYKFCVKQQIIEPALKMSTKELTLFLSTQIFGVDVCNGTGYLPGKFSISETDTSIIFKLDPCGSGGRLINAASYEPMKKMQEIREKSETSIIKLLSHNLPLPEPLVRSIFPYVVNHFTQRKPDNLEKTKNAHSWSFNKSEMPCYCCQCGMIQKKLGRKYLKILPPKGKNKPCVWELSKNR
jgi:hypothetical protein